MKFKYRRYYLYYLGRCLAFLFYAMPFSVGLSIVGFFGDIAFLILGAYRRVAIDNLTAAFGKEKSDVEIRAIARGVFRNVARIAVELVNFPKINSSNIDSIVRIDHPEIIEAAYKAGRGIIVLTAHFGNWELLAMTLRVKGYPGVAVGRKNYLFAGSDRGGERAAAIYSLIETAKLNGLDPQAWLRDVLERIADHPNNRIGELLPWNWSPATPAAEAA